MALDLSHLVTDVTLKPPRILVYSMAGVGKTTLGRNFPDPVFLQLEDGEGVEAMPRWTPEQLTSFNAILEAGESLLTGEHNFKTIVVDVIDGLERIIQAEVAAAGNKPNIEDFGYGKGYGRVVDYFTKLMQLLNALRNDRGMIVLLLAHAKVVNFHDPEVGPYDRFELRMHKTAGAYIHDQCDVVGFLSIARSVVQTDQGFNKITARGTTSGQRVIHLTPSPAHLAKNRYSLPGMVNVSLKENGLLKAIDKAFGKSEPKTKSTKK